MRTSRTFQFVTSALVVCCLGMLGTANATMTPEPTMTPTFCGIIIFGTPFPCTPTPVPTETPDCFVIISGVEVACTSTPIPTLTPTPTPICVENISGLELTCTPTKTPTPSKTATKTPTPSPTMTPTATFTAVPTCAPCTEAFIKTFEPGWNNFGFHKRPAGMTNASDLLDSLVVQGVDARFIAQYTSDGWSVFTRGLPFGDFCLNSPDGFMIYCGAGGSWAFVIDNCVAESPCE